VPAGRARGFLVLFLDNLVIIRTRALLPRAGFGAGSLPDKGGAGLGAAVFPLDWSRKKKKFPARVLTAAPYIWYSIGVEITAGPQPGKKGGKQWKSGLLISR